MIIIGEKINGAIPKTGKAIEEKDEAYIRELARMQTEAGADYIDCCASVDEGEFEVMKWLIDIIQDEVDTPIVLDSPDENVLVKCIDLCDRVGIVNSIAMEDKKIDTIMPVVQGTDWGVIAMMNDDNGIPPTADGRIDVCKRLVARTDEYDFPHDQIYVDALVETLGTNNETMTIFTDTIKGIKEAFPEIHFTSGLSNVSFGLPGRKNINMPFMALAMNAGMDSAIVDPMNRDMMGVIYGTNALLENDDFCIEYITAYREGIIGPPLEERD